MATPEGQTEPTVATPVEDAEMSGGAAPEAPTNEAALATPAAETKPKEYDNAEVVSRDNRTAFVPRVRE